MEIYSGGNNLTDKPIFIDFYATWWGPCKIFEQVLNKVTPDYENKISFYKVNIEDEPQMSSLFQVRGVPFMIMISNSGELSANVGGMDETTLKYYLDGLISKK